MKSKDTVISIDLLFLVISLSLMVTISGCREESGSYYCQKSDLTKDSYPVSGISTFSSSSAEEKAIRELPSMNIDMALIKSGIMPNDAEVSFYSPAICPGFENCAVAIIKTPYLHFNIVILKLKSGCYEKIADLGDCAGRNLAYPPMMIRIKGDSGCKILFIISNGGNAGYGFSVLTEPAGDNVKMLKTDKISMRPLIPEDIDGDGYAELLAMSLVACSSCKSEAVYINEIYCIKNGRFVNTSSDYHDYYEKYIAGLNRQIRESNNDSYRRDRTEGISTAKRLMGTSGNGTNPDWQTKFSGE